MTYNLNNYFFFYLTVCSTCFFLQSKAAAQLSGMRDISKSNSTQSSFTYRIVSTYGTSTSSQVSGNMTADTEAVLKLKSGSKVTNKSGDASGNSTAVFTVSPNGANVSLTGLTGENLFLIDEGTYFRSALKTIDNPNTALTSTGSASATAIHSMTISVEKSSNSIQNYLEKAY